MIKRMIGFDRKDWAHCWWLVTQMMRGWWNGDMALIVDSWMWLKVHILYDSQRLN